MSEISGGGAYLHAKQALLDDIVAAGRKEVVYGFVTWHIAGMSILRCLAPCRLITFKRKRIGVS